jgi:alpha-1,3/alpha-1,6-mannosyltransferase
MMTLVSLIDRAKACSLSYAIITPSTSTTAIPPFNATATTPATAHILFLLNFTTSQRSALLHSSLALLYTPANEHFGIGPVEGMFSGLPVLACDSGGPMESVIDMGDSSKYRTGWLRPPHPDIWAEALHEILGLTDEERQALGERSRARAKGVFSMEAMAAGIEKALKDAAGQGPVPSLGLLNLLLSVLGFCIAYWFGTWILFTE